MNKNFPMAGDVRTLTDYFGEIVPPCVQVCMTLKRTDILFEQVPYQGWANPEKFSANPEKYGQLLLEKIYMYI